MTASNTPEESGDGLSRRTLLRAASATSVATGIAVGTAHLASADMSAADSPNLAGDRLSIPSKKVLLEREKVVLAHFTDEVEHDWDGALADFPHPHYELIASMTVHDGTEAVRGYYEATRAAFPDQRHEIIALRHSHDAVIVEFWLLGTHKGAFGGLPATGQTHRTRMTAYFTFDAKNDIVSERIYFDQLTVVGQLLRNLDLSKEENLLLLGRISAGLIAASGKPDARLTNTTVPEFAR